MRTSASRNWMREAVRLARRGYGFTSPNPMVGAILVKGGKIIGRGWHRRAGLPHAEIEALRDAENRGANPAGATLFVTLEPCCTQGRTPPCTEAIIAARIKRVVVGATDPNPKHRGKGFRILKHAGIEVIEGVEADACARLNENFNFWIVHRTPFVTVKAAMTLDGKIATAAGESKWITSEAARRSAMMLRLGSDAILVGVNTILRDDPSLTCRDRSGRIAKPLRRIVLDSMARTPPAAKILNDEFARLTTIVASRRAPKTRVAELLSRVDVVFLPEPSKNSRSNRPDLKRLLEWLGSENVTGLLVEGGGEVNASFLLGGFANRIVFFYAPKVLGGHDSLRSVAGDGAERIKDVLQLSELQWRSIGPDLFLTARV